MSELTSVSMRTATAPLVLFVSTAGATTGTPGLAPTVSVSNAVNAAEYYDFATPRIASDGTGTRSAPMVDLGLGYYRYDLPIAAAQGLVPGTLLQATYSVGTFTDQDLLLITAGSDAVVAGTVAVDNQGTATGDALAKQLFDEKEKRAEEAKILPDPQNPPPAYQTAIDAGVLALDDAIKTLTQARLDELRLYAIDANAQATALAVYLGGASASQ